MNKGKLTTRKKPCRQGLTLPPSPTHRRAGSSVHSRLAQDDAARDADISVWEMALVGKPATVPLSGIPSSRSWLRRQEQKPPSLPSGSPFLGTVDGGMHASELSLWDPPGWKPGVCFPFLISASLALYSPRGI